MPRRWAMSWVSDQRPAAGELPRPGAPTGGGTASSSQPRAPARADTRPTPSRVDRRRPFLFEVVGRPRTRGEAERRGGLPTRQESLGADGGLMDCLVPVGGATVRNANSDGRTHQILLGLPCVHLRMFRLQPRWRRDLSKGSGRPRGCRADGEPASPGTGGAGGGEGGSCGMPTGGSGAQAGRGGSAGPRRVRAA